MPKDIEFSIDRLYREMRGRIELLPPERRLPSYRALLASHRCSRQTLTRTLQRLEEDGVIRTEKRRGMFATPDPRRRARRILFLRVDWCCEHAEQISGALDREFSRRRNYHYTELRYPPEKIAAFLEDLEETAADLLILWLEEVEPLRLLKLFQQNIPLVFFDCGIMLANCSIFDLEEEQIGMLAAKHLIDCGHREIALLITEPKGLTCRKRMNGFLDYLHVNGLKPHVIDCEIQHGESSSGMAHDFFLSYLERNRVDFTAGFAMSDDSALGVIKALQESGFRVPEDVSIVGGNGITIGERSDPPLTTVIFDPAEAARELAAGVDELFAGGSFGIRRIPPRLVSRGTVRNLTPSTKGVES